VGPTFRSLNCRLAALLAQVNAAPDLGTLQARLRELVELAKDRKEQAEDACREPDSHDTKKQLKKAGRKVNAVLHILRSRRARKFLPPMLREELLATADAIRGDLQTLKREVRCPDDAA
jgi:hypothetical protein